jgi:elongation factor G
VLLPFHIKGCKINVLDTPGYFDFSGETLEALRVADAGIIVCSAREGISVGYGKGVEVSAGAQYAPRHLHLQNR